MVGVRLCAGVKPSEVQALDAGARISGCTVHLVEDALDAGPIVGQSAIEVHDDDTLATLEARIHAAEYALYPAAVHRFLTVPWAVEGRRLVFGSREPARG